MQSWKLATPSATDEIEIQPKQRAALKRQLKAANARLLSIERERQQVRADVETLAALLQRAERGEAGPAKQPRHEKPKASQKR
jgi:hypothetical protein